MKEQSSFRERAKFSQRILHSSWRILRSPMPNEHPGTVSECILNLFATYLIVFNLKETLTLSLPRSESSFS